MHRLEASCQTFMVNGLAPSTRRSYVSAQRKFLKFSVDIGILTPVPATERTLCLFASYLAQSLRYPSIKVYMSAIRSLHIEQGYQDPTANCLQLQRLVRGIKRTQGHSARLRLPITAPLLQTILSSLNLTTYDDTMLWAACTMAYFGFLRASEFTVPNLASFSSEMHLQARDLSFDKVHDPTCLRIFIKKSKTDPFGHGCHIHIGRTDSALCPITAIASYLHRRGDSPGPLFLHASGKPLSRDSLTSQLRSILAKANVPGNFSSHSFRIGAATTAGINGIPDHTIKTLGRWNSQSYMLYTRTSPSVLAELSRKLS